MIRYVYLGATVLILQILSWLTSYFVTQQAVTTWYRDIEKSTLNPPDWVFAPVWIVLYAMLGVVLWRLWLARALKPARITLGLFLTQLAINYAWSFVFFGMANFQAAFLMLLAIVILSAVTMIRAYSFDRMVTWLMIPYLAWVSFATWLTFAVMRLN